MKRDEGRGPCRRRDGDERGAVAIEAALVTGVVLAMILGILEMAFLMKDNVGVASAARVGARAASTGAAAGPCIAQPGDVVPCPANGVPELAQTAADAVASARTVLPRDAITHIMVYRVDEPSSSSTPVAVSACTTECVVYKWSPAQDRFRYHQGSWDSRQIFGCADPDPLTGDTLDGVGVEIGVKHTFLTGIFGRSMDLSDHAVLSFEPLTNAACKKGKHQ